MDGELYSYLLTLSKGIKDKTGKGITYIDNKDFPPATKIASKLNKCRQTIATHLKYLEEKGYIKEDKINHRWVILNPERFFYTIPIDTLQYILDTMTRDVIKIYVYLGTQYNYKPNYEFTNKELCAHLGLNYTKNSTKISNIIDILQKSGLIDFIIMYNDKGFPYMKLTKFTKKCPISKGSKELC